jgi:hypothetical protein
VEEEVPENGGWAKDGEAEQPARVAGESAAGRKGTRRREKAKVSEEALLSRSSKAKKLMNACVHTYTKSQTPSTRRRGPGWRIHGSAEDIKLSTNKQHTLSLVVVAAPSPLSISRPPSSLYRCLSLSLASGARAGLCQDPNSDSLRACKNGAV